MRVLKFGGSSIADTNNIRAVAEIVGKRKAERLAIVFSAMQGVTDALIDAGRLAEAGDDGFIARIAEIREKHFETVYDLFGDEIPGKIEEYIDSAIKDLGDTCEGVRLVRELSSRTLDRILSFGELAASNIISTYFASAGIANLWKDSREIIKTDSAFGAATVDFSKSEILIKEFFAPRSENVFVFPGFIGSDGSNSTTTSHFGAKVVYPPTIQPVMASGIPILVKNTFSPEDPGTLIESESRAGKEIIRGISSIDNIAVLSLEGSGMVGVPGFSRRLFGALSRARINVILITQSSSEHSICVAVEQRFGDTARQAVDAEFEHEIIIGKIEPLRAETGFSILALVGDNMKEHTGISGRMFAALGQNGINVHAIAQGSSERNISAIIAATDTKKAVNTLHEEFFSDGSRQVNLFIAGAGKVGSRLLEQLRVQQQYLLENLRLNVRVIAIANSRHIVSNTEGIDLNDWQAGLANEPVSAGGADIALSKLIIANNLRNSIFVDITASPALPKIYALLLRKSVSVIACNKIAASSDYENYLRIKDTAREYNANFLFETNVGAGLPVINTLNDLLRSGDRIRRIEAVLSGTLNFVFNNYDGGRKFADVVSQAQNEGYTEPDPRLDLSGTDVARKILILAREAGYRMEMEDIENKRFLPASCFEGTVGEFYAAMQRNEKHFSNLLEAAQEKNQILKYIALFDDGRASVGLQSIGADHNFATLSGKDNAVLFYTDRYVEQPLVIKGAGAGADVTAAGVFADIIRAAKS
ncbi:MAG: bifunctional aspartate kinase/homoserine dehydrogenase I [Acidobacteria bacterium]|nr:bifunctional aspartate kinase/homoserine dehydrogenase I [Acidobacteriota bacterium]